MSRSRASAASAASAAPATSELPKYELTPPAWRPQIHPNQQTFPDFYPSCPGGPEDDVSEAVVKTGYTAQHIVKHEYFSAHSLVFDRLMAVREAPLLRMSAVMDEILRRREAIVGGGNDGAGAVGPHTPRLPSRVTLNDMKLAAWIRDLADPNVPLQKVGRSLPHGYRGERMLDMLWGGGANRRPVDINRAVWFIRVSGASEMQSSRNKANFNYPVELTTAFTAYLRKQLNEITMPSSSAPTGIMSARQAAPALRRSPTKNSLGAGGAGPAAAPGVLADSEARRNWIDRFSYTMSLLKALYSASLLDSQTILRWSLDQLQPANLAQLPFVLTIVDEFLEKYLSSTAHVHVLWEGCIKRWEEIKEHPARKALASVKRTLERLLQSAFLGSPDSFICPRLWLAHRTSLHRILVDKPSEAAGGSSTSSSAEAFLSATLQDDFLRINRRNDALLMQWRANQASKSIRAQEVDDIALLDSISSSASMRYIHDVFFGQSCDDALEPATSTRSFGDKLDTLLTWATTPLRTGNHRAYAVGSILAVHVGGFNNDEQWVLTSSQRKDRKQKLVELQEASFSWLDKVDAPPGSSTLEEIVIVFGELVRLGLFSFVKYLQRLIAKGIKAASTPNAAKHQYVLRNVPLFSPSPSLLSQRHVAIHGVTRDVSREEKSERRAIRELRSVFPVLFRDAVEQNGEGIQGRLPCNAAELRARLPHVFSATRFTQSRVVQVTLLPSIVGDEDGEKRENAVQGMSGDELAALLILLDALRDYAALWKVISSVSAKPPDKAWQSVLSDAFQCFADVWICMGVIRPHQVTQSPDLHQANSCLQPAASSGPGHQNGSQMQCVSPFNSSLSSETSFPQLLELFRSTTLAGPDIADRLFIKYHASPFCLEQVWTDTIQLLAELDDIGQDSQVSRIGDMLARLSKLTNTSLDKTILRWASDGNFDPQDGASSGLPVSPSQNNLPIWYLLLQELILSAELSSTTLLSAVVVPLLRSNERNPDPTSALEIGYALVHFILGVGAEGAASQSDTVAGASPFRAFHLWAQRQALFEPSTFPQLLRLVSLLAFHERTSKGTVAADCAVLREHITRLPMFRGSALRDLEESGGIIVRELADQGQSEDTDVICMQILHSSPPSEVNGFPPGAQDDSTAASVDSDVWHAHAASLRFRLTLAKLCGDMKDPQKAPAADAALDELVEQFFSDQSGTLGASMVQKHLASLDVVGLSKFAEVAFKRLLGDLENSAFKTQTDSSSRISSSELCRQLAYIISRSEGHRLPALSSPVCEQLLAFVTHVFEAIAQGSPRADDDPKWRDDVELLVHVLHAVLRTQSAFSGAGKTYAPRLACALIRVALRFEEEEDDHVGFTALLDTLVYFLDELPKETKACAYDAISQAQPSILSCAATSEVRGPVSVQVLARLRHVLPPDRQDSLAEGLVIAPSVSAAAAEDIAPVIAKPWEWAELIEPLNDVQSRTAPLRNAGSLSLASFSVRKTREIPESAITHKTTLESERSYDEGVESVSLYAKGFRRGLAPTSFADDVEDDKSVDSDEDGAGSPDGVKECAAQSEEVEELDKKPPGEVIDLSADSPPPEAAPPSNLKRSNPKKRQAPEDVIDDADVSAAAVPAPTKRGGKKGASIRGKKRK